MRNINQKGFSVVEVVLGIALVAVIGVAGYFAYQNQRNNADSNAKTTHESSNSQSPTAQPRPTDAPAGWVKFSHPTAGYSLYYPKDWKGGLGPIEGVAHLPEAKVDFEDFYIETADRKIAQGYPTLEQGAEIYVTASKTTETSVEKIYSSDQLAATVNHNKTSTTVDGQQAIQYDYAYEQIKATVTMFMKDGVLYRATFRYVDDKGKQALWTDYTQLLASFKLK